MRPYDGKTHRYRHDDPAPREGRQILARLLSWPGDLPPDARYAMSFYSGGMGIFDRCAAAVPCADVARLDALGLQPLDALTGSDRDAALWLLEAERDDPQAIAEALRDFVADFSPLLLPPAGAFCVYGDVNSHKFAYLAGGLLCWGLYDQG